MTFRTPEQRAREKFTAPDEGCWLWHGSTQRGYGRIIVDYKVLRAHRFVYEWLVGPIPEGMELDHLCRVRNCVLPDHLEPVTHQENMQRAALDRGPVTTCLRGHPFDEANTYHNPNGKRQCRTCRREHDNNRQKERE